MPLPIAFRALTHRNYRLFLIGQGVSLIGSWMQHTGLSWLVYQITGDPFLLGLVAFCGQIPVFFLAPVAGVLSDRLDRRRTLLFTQSIAMAQSLLLVLLTLSGRIEIWQIIALSAVLGAVNAFDMPTRQAFLSEMAPTRADLPNAIALNSSMVNFCRFVGPFLGGLLIAAAGVGACFVANAVTYVAVFAALALMRDLPARPRHAGGPVHRGLIEGFAYAFSFVPIRALLLMVAIISLLAMPVTTLLPVFAKDILHGGPQLFGYLGAVSGVGALTAALYLASRRSVVGLGGRVSWAGIAFGLGMIAFSFSQSVSLSMAILPVTGFSMMLLLAGCNTMLQTIVDDDKRGRIMSLYAMAFMGTAPVGSLLAGGLAYAFSAPLAARINGVLCIAGVAALAFRLPSLQDHAESPGQDAAPAPQIAVAVETVAELQTAAEETA